MKGRLIALGLILLLGAAVGSRSILHRLQAGTLAAQAHSGEFRIWTWKGDAKLIEDHPILGTGPGTFDYTYPRYALVGFAAHAHNSYLQIAGDIGIPGLFFVLATFMGALLIGVKAIGMSQVKEEEGSPALAPPAKKKARKAEPAPEPESPGRLFLDQTAPPEDRWVLIGLLGGLVAGLIQNLIDSDLYLLFNGVTTIALTGFIFAIAQNREAPVTAPPRRAISLAGTAVCGLVVVGMFWNGIATSYAAAGDYQSAQGMEPLSGPFTSLLGWRTYLPQGNAGGAEMALRRATELAPDSISFNHLGDYYLYAKQPEAAVISFQDGLRFDPNSLELLLKTAQTEDSLGHHADALRYYAKMAALQQAPYGRILAITEVTEYRYAYADSAVGNQNLIQGNLQAAQANFQSAQRVLEAYAREGGSRNIMRLAENGHKSDSDLDQGLQQLYQQVMAQLEQIAVQTGKPDRATALKARAAMFAPKFTT
ncbi:MAG TPA: O-antigen ligase family protein, partial [Capsulimonadaceae bacterium]|nr:O-antigen ligase family protein [Capsulimonadaceae bacterium]